MPVNKPIDILHVLWLKHLLYTLQTWKIAKTDTVLPPIINSICYSVHSRRQTNPSTQPKWKRVLSTCLTTRFYQISPPPPQRWSSTHTTNIPVSHHKYPRLTSLRIVVMQVNRFTGINRNHRPPPVKSVWWSRNFLSNLPNLVPLITPCSLADPGQNNCNKTVEHVVPVIEFRLPE